MQLDFCRSLLCILLPELKRWVWLCVLQREGQDKMTRVWFGIEMFKLPPVSSEWSAFVKPPLSLVSFWEIASCFITFFSVKRMHDSTGHKLRRPCQTHKCVLIVQVECIQKCIFKTKLSTVYRALTLTSWQNHPTSFHFLAGLGIPSTLCTCGYTDVFKMASGTTLESPVWSNLD